MTLADTVHGSSVAVLVLALVVGAWLYRKLRRAGELRGRRRRTLTLAAAVVVFVGAMIGPLDWLGEERLMSAHMVQHLLLITVVPALLLLAAPASWFPRRMTGTAATGCLLVGVGLIWLLHLPALLESGLTRPWLHEAQHVLLLGAGLLLALPLTPAGYRLGFGAAFYLVAAELTIGALGIWLAWSPELIYSSYADAPRMWGLSAATDQSLAGALLLVVEEPFLAIEFAVVFIRALGSSTSAVR